MKSGKRHICIRSVRRIVRPWSDFLVHVPDADADASSIRTSYASSNAALDPIIPNSIPLHACIMTASLIAGPVSFFRCLVWWALALACCSSGAHRSSDHRLALVSEPPLR